MSSLSDDDGSWPEIILIANFTFVSHRLQPITCDLAHKVFDENLSTQDFQTHVKTTIAKDHLLMRSGIIIEAI